MATAVRGGGRAGGLGWRLEILDAVPAAGVLAAAVVLPFAVAPRYYDLYYWPKVVGLYALVAPLTLLAFWRGRERWLGALGTPAGRALAVWLAALAAATILSIDPLQSLVGEDYRYEGLLTWLVYGGLVLLTASALTTAAQTRTLLRAVLAAAGVMSALGLLQHWGWMVIPADTLRTGWTRAWATTGNPIALGAYLVLLLPAAVTLYAGAERPAGYLAFGAAAVVMYAALIATAARGAWGALGIGLVVWGIAVGPSRLRRCAGPLLVLAFAWAVVTPVVLMSGAPETAAHVSDAQSAGTRWYLWRTTVPLVAERPIFGWGPETLARIYPAYGTPEFTRRFPGLARVIVDRPHNDLLQQAVGTGLVGLGAYVWFWYHVFRAAARRAGGVGGTASGGAQVPLRAGLLGGLAAYFLQLQLSFSFASVAPVCWVIVGIALAPGPKRESETYVRTA